MMTRHYYRHSHTNFTVILRQFRQTIGLAGALFCLMISPSPIQAKEIKEPTLLKCLGQEELLIHKQKLGGAIYRLNQKLVNEVASWDKIHLKQHHIKNVCAPEAFSPSLTLMRVFLLHGEESFDFEKDEFKFENLQKYQAQVIQDFLDRIPKIFFSYLADLQTMMNNPKCLQKTIPELNYFYERYRYLEGDISTEQLIQTKKARKKLRSIFKSLENFDSLVETCQKE